MSLQGNKGKTSGSTEKRTFGTQGKMAASATRGGLAKIRWGGGRNACEGKKIGVTETRKGRTGSSYGTPIACPPQD